MAYLSSIAGGDFTFHKLQLRADSGYAAVRKLRHIAGIRHGEAGDATFLREGQSIAGTAEIDFDHVAQSDLSSSDQVRDRINQVTLDGPLEVARTVFQIGSFPKQEFFRLRSTSEDELFIGLRRHDAILDVVEFDIQHLTQMLLVKRPEDHDLIDAVHEFRGELPFRHVQRRVIHLLVDFRQTFVVLTDT